MFLLVEDNAYYFVLVCVSKVQKSVMIRLKDFLNTFKYFLCELMINLEEEILIFKHTLSFDFSLQSSEFENEKRL